MSNVPAINCKDAYKIGHVFQYPEGTQEIYSNLTARSGNHSNVPTDKVTFIGLQYFIKDFLIREFNETFFNKPKELVLKSYQRRVSRILGSEIDISHIKKLHDLGYLPLDIKALPEGSRVPYGVPLLTVRNTRPDISNFYWLTNMIESVLSSELWLPITSATTYTAYKEVFKKYADLTGVSEEFIPYQGHDFSYRGMAGRHAAATSSMAVLLAGCIGTDSIPGIDYCEEFYGANVDEEIVGQSVSATEHSVMCAGGQENELDTLKRLLTEIYPTGIISVVSDSWDFFHLVEVYLRELKEIILSRDGKLVVRPDSGDPVKIICGDKFASEECVRKGLIECLWDIFGGTINEKGFKVLDSHIGAIYGDSITYERANQILEQLYQKGFASSNIVLGIGSYTYQYVTRDTHGMAVKSTHAIINNNSIDIFKNPKTDSGTKKSAKGYLMVTKVGDEFKLVEQVTFKQSQHGCLETVFLNGALTKETSLSEIRSRLK